MKKILLFVVFIVVIAMLPLVGNKVVKNTINQRLELLNSYGLKSKLIKEEKSYLETKTSYDLVVVDEKKLIKYLQQFSSKQLPPYTTSLLSGVEFRIDLSYLNLPLSDKLNIIIYPTKLSEDIMIDLKQQSPKLYKFVNEILKERAIEYHIKYAVVLGEFDAWVKDFDKTLKDDKAKLNIKFQDVKSSGEGMLLAPDSLKTHIKNFEVSFSSEKGEFKIDFKDIDTSSTFESDTTYITTFRSKNILLDMVEKPNKHSKIEAKDFVFDISSNTQGKKAQVFSKAAATFIEFINLNKTFKFKDFNYELSLKDLEKSNYIKLQKLLEKSSYEEMTFKQQQELQEVFLKLIANGFELSVVDFSTKKIVLPTKEEIDGFDIELLLNLKENQNLLQNKQISSKDFSDKIILNSKMRFSNQVYELINQIYPVSIMFNQYKKVQDGNVIFDVELKKSKLYINSKEVK